MSAAAAPGRRGGARGRGRTGGLYLDPFESLVLAVLTALGLGVLALLIVRVWIQGDVVTGADGYLVADPMQYLAWSRQVSEHGLIGNPYDLAPGSASFLHPGLLLSGFLVWLGVGPAVAYLLWKPFAIGVLFTGTLLYVRRFLDRRDDRRLALVLALFACSPVAALFGWGKIGGPGDKLTIDFITGELWNGSYLWGYLFTAIAVGLMPLALLAYERGRGGEDPRALVGAAVAGLFVAWLQPWQGATLAIVLVGAEVVGLRRGRFVAEAVRDLLAPLVAIAIPLVYYFLLSRGDASWELAGRINDLPRWPWWALLLGPLPLTLPALLAYRLPAPDFGDVALRLWPIAALLVYFQPAGTFPFHAWQGLTLPLVVLGALALRHHLGRRSIPRWPAVAAVVVLAGIGTVYRASELADAIHLGRQPFFLKPGERDALRYLDAAPEPGGVLTPVYSGIVVPAYTGREVWIGAGSWTPDFDTRHDLTERLFGGQLDAARARAVVRESGARFLYSDCHGRADIAATVKGFTDPPRRFGCATVWRVR